MSGAVVFLAQSGLPVSGTTLITIAAVLLGLVLVVVVLMVLFARVSRASQGGIADVGGLQRLSGNSQLTPEEAAKVAAALSRKMTKLAEENRRVRQGASLEQLALEAQMIAAQAKAEKAARQEQGAPDEAAPSTPAQPPEDASAAQPAGAGALPPRVPLQREAVLPAQEALKLPPHLQHLAHRSPTELDDLVNAGFLTREDADLVIVFRKANGE